MVVFKIVLSGMKYKGNLFIYEHLEYHLAMIHFLDDLAHSGPGGSDTPRRPKGGLASLLGNKNLPISCTVLSYTNICLKSLVYGCC